MCFERHADFLLFIKRACRKCQAEKQRKTTRFPFTIAACLKLNKDAAVTYTTYLVNLLLAESMSLNPQPHQKKNSFVELVLHSLIIGIAVEIEPFKKIITLTVLTGTIFIQKIL